jgi:hypothetical protein
MTKREMPYGFNSASVERKHKCHMDWTPSKWNGNTNAIWTELRQCGIETQIPYGLNFVSVELKHKCHMDWTLSVWNRNTNAGTKCHMDWTPSVWNGNTNAIWIELRQCGIETQMRYLAGCCAWCSQWELRRPKFGCWKLLRAKADSLNKTEPIDVTYCNALGYLTTSEHQMYRVRLLKTPLGF